MLTDDEWALLRDAYAVWTWEDDETELSFGVTDDVLPQAHRATEVGLLERRWCRECGDHHYRLTPLGAEVAEFYVGEAASRN